MWDAGGNGENGRLEFQAFPYHTTKKSEITWLHTDTFVSAHPNNSEGGCSAAALYAQLLAQYEMMLDYVAHSLSQGDLRLVRGLYSLNMNSKDGRVWEMLCEAAQIGGSRAYRAAYLGRIAGYTPPFGTLQILE